MEDLIITNQRAWSSQILCSVKLSSLVCFILKTQESSPQPLLPQTQGSSPQPLLSQTQDPDPSPSS